MFVISLNRDGAQYDVVSLAVCLCVSLLGLSSLNSLTYGQKFWYRPQGLFLWRFDGQGRRSRSPGQKMPGFCDLSDQLQNPGLLCNVLTVE